MDIDSRNRSIDCLKNAKEYILTKHTKISESR